MKRALLYQWAAILIATSLYWGVTHAISKPLSFSPGAQYSVCFSPKGGCEKKLLQFIRTTKHKLLVFSYSFTSYPVTRAIIRLHQQGVDVRLIVDRSLFDPKNKHSKIQQVIQAGIPVWVDPRVSIQHNKVMISDGARVETGSYNYTVSANRYNAENMLIIDDPHLAQDYEKNWHHRLSSAVPSHRYHYRKRRRRR